MQTSMFKTTPYLLFCIIFVLFYSVTAYAQKGDAVYQTTGKDNTAGSNMRRVSGGSDSGSGQEKAGGEAGDETAGNNLSFPVIWGDSNSEGIATKALRGTPGVINLNGAMWYWWGINEDESPKSCKADEENLSICSNGQVPCGGDRQNPDPQCRAVFPQQDVNNDWQAESAGADSTVVNVNWGITWIDWGDNLESADWYTRSMVRTEVVLSVDLNERARMTEYVMRHLSGWGITELWGLSTNGLRWGEGEQPHTYYNQIEEVKGEQATVYSGCARLTIQKLLLERGTDQLKDLEWDLTKGQWTEPTVFPDSYPDGVAGSPYPNVDLINDPIFNETVWEAGDGPGYYSAEINVKGKVIYGYTWSLRDLYDATSVSYADSANPVAGDYRITFSLDNRNCPYVNHTYFISDGTKFMEESVVEEGEIATESESEEGGGATGAIDGDNNLTFIDIRVSERSGGQRGKRK